MKIGAAYYPEHWLEECQEADIAHMRLAGFNLVRLGEFAWQYMEPEPDVFDFEWLDRALNRLHAAGISALIGTPTAGPPIWMTSARLGLPDCRMVYEDGSRWEPGGRSLCCVNHPFFVERSLRIATELGSRYAGHAAVIGFQIDNELGMFGTRCYCPTCLTLFRDWLHHKYGTINALNDRLGMGFGGNRFLDFEDVPLPRLRQDMHNNGLLLDSQRFFSESNVRYVAAQARALRDAGARQPITTNVCHMFGGGRDGHDAIDGVELFRALDVVGWDCYPQQFAANPPSERMGLLHTIARGYLRKRYWMLEQQAGSPMGMVADDARRIRLWTWQSVAHGATTLLYFNWRTFPFGHEQYWRGILDHDGEPNRRFDVVRQTAQEIHAVAPLLERLEWRNDAAILLDHESAQSLALAPPGGGVAYRAEAERWFSALARAGIGLDVVFDSAHFDRYALLIAPMLRLTDAALAEALRQFVQRGGTLVVSPVTGTLNRDHVALPERPPYCLKDVLGVERIEWGSLDALPTAPKEMRDAKATSPNQNSGLQAVGVEATVNSPLRGGYDAGVWYDELILKGATALAMFAAGSPAAGAPAVTVHAFGEGRAFYVATILEPRFYADMARLLIDDRRAGVRQAEPSADVEIVPCTDQDARCFFVLNHSATPQTVLLDQPFQDMLNGDDVRDAVSVAGYDVRLFRQRI